MAYSLEGIIGQWMVLLVNITLSWKTWQEWIQLILSCWVRPMAYSLVWGTGQYLALLVNITLSWKTWQVQTPYFNLSRSVRPGAYSWKWNTVQGQVMPTILDYPENLAGTNTLAYFVSPSATKTRKFHNIGARCLTSAGFAASSRRTRATTRRSGNRSWRTTATSRRISRRGKQTTTRQ